MQFEPVRASRITTAYPVITSGENTYLGIEKAQIVHEREKWKSRRKKQLNSNGDVFWRAPTGIPENLHVPIETHPLMYRSFAAAGNVL